jgi:hypothetical protein
MAAARILSFRRDIPLSWLLRGFPPEIKAAITDAMAALEAPRR